jgi:hypothetical protein
VSWLITSSSFVQHRVDTAANEFAAQVGDNAEGTAMVAALRNLEVAVMARGQLQPALRHEVDERTLRRRCGVVDGIDHLLILMRAGDREDVGEAGADDVGLIAHAAGDDDTAILGHCLADRLQAFFLRRVEKAARIHEDDVGAGIVGRQAIAVGAQLGQNPFAVDKRLGAAERNHADFRLGGERFDCHDWRRP